MEDLKNREFITNPNLKLNSIKKSPPSNINSNK